MPNFASLTRFELSVDVKLVVTMYLVESNACLLPSQKVPPPEGRMIVPPGQSEAVNGTRLPLVSRRRVPKTLTHCRPAPVYAPPLGLYRGATGLPSASTAVM